MAEADQVQHVVLFLLALFLLGFGAFRAFDGFGRRRLATRLLGDHRRRRDRGDGEVAVGDGRDDAVGQVHMADVNAVADLEAGEVDLEGMWDRVDRAEHLDLVAHDVEHAAALDAGTLLLQSEEHTSELQSLMRNSYAVFCLKKKPNTTSTF